MSNFHVIKQLEERNGPNEIGCMVWSDRMDLVALSNIKGEVTLHRLSWTRAWTLSPPNDGIKVAAIAWSPDGKILAIGYNSGQVSLVNTENKKTLSVKRCPSEISYLSWFQEKIVPKPKDILSMKDEDKNDYMKYIDLSKLYLRDPTPSSTIDSTSTVAEDVKETNLLAEQSAFNLLLTGTKDGLVLVRIFGCFTCISLNMAKYIGQPCSVEHIHLSENLSTMLVTVKCEDRCVKIIQIDSSILKTHSRELFALAVKFVKLIDLITYLTNTISNITETWESFLLEIDHKLSNYAANVPEGGVSADFLDLLVFGICSPELEEFLMTELTKKDLEKFGQTIEMSYANIQKLLLKNVSNFGQNFTYHLAELRGMARLEFRYKILGLSEEKITNAIRSSGAFLIKAGEMQQIINNSVINYKAFFRWLYGAILNLMGESIPSEIHKMTQQDLAYITEFLQNFDHIGSKNSTNKKGFKMERLGQYLVDEPLMIPSDMKGNDWATFLKENHCLSSHPSILNHYKDKSLIQQFKELAADITAIFDIPKNALDELFIPLQLLNDFSASGEGVRVSSINVGDKILFALLFPMQEMHLIEINSDKSLRGSNVKFVDDTSSNYYKIIDVSFYSPTIISLLLQEPLAPKQSIIAQFPLTTLLENLQEIVHSKSMQTITIPISAARTSKNTEMAASCFAVSGSRRVSIVLGENRRKVKLFEMEAEEEDEDDTELNSTNLREDISMTDE